MEKVYADFCKSCGEQTTIETDVEKTADGRIYTKYSCSECGRSAYIRNLLFKRKLVGGAGRQEEKKGPSQEEKPIPGEPERPTEEQRKEEATKDSKEEAETLKKDLEENEGPGMVMMLPLDMIRYEILKERYKTGRRFGLPLPVDESEQDEKRWVFEAFVDNKKPCLRYFVNDDDGNRVAVVWLLLDKMDPFPEADHVNFYMNGFVKKIVDHEDTPEEFKGWATGRGQIPKSIPKPILMPGRQLGKATKFNEWVKEFKNTKDGLKEVMIPMKKEAVNSPNHYQMEVKGVKCEAIDIMEAVMTKEEMIGFALGNAFKYLMRFRKKNKLEDLKKGRYYLDYAIRLMEQEGSGENE